ncbi:hypothetical protein PFLmoz3_05267 [Pseudomonas fluorescens]|uniref:Uncharacterized protein n=1 Tax=Pseudomonas fluorescens TaxID=294 RepID=A0A125QHN9_PSEFL|nr:hypothetical protein PFLmoz3_05267 [Pseudomonas fluorescens]
MRINSRFWHWARLGGRSVNWLPASISFCSKGRSPSSSGNWLMQLSVRISQRNCGGRAAAATWLIWLALKPIMLSLAHWPRHCGSSVKALSEQNSTRRFVRRCRSSGRLLRALPVRLRISSESASSKISRGNSVSPQARSRRVTPANWPALSWARVFMQGAVLGRRRKRRS